MIEHLESNVEEWTSKSSRMDLPLLHFIFLIQSANILLVRLKKTNETAILSFLHIFFLSQHIYVLYYCSQFAFSAL